MGHRARRRLIAGLAVLGAVAAVGLGLLLLTGSKPASHAKSGSSSDIPGWESHYVGATDRRYDANYRSLVFGMTKTQVRKLVGPPTRVVGGCWEYRVNQYVSGAGQHSTFNADRLCFLEGKYSDSHHEVNGRWDYQPKIVFTQ